MRTFSITPGEYYHIFNRGNNKQLTFLDNRDRVRFLFLITHLQSPAVFQNISRQVAHYVKNSAFNIDSENELNVVQNREVEIISFALMPNHFHLLVSELKSRGIAHYMQRVLCAYTKYFNTKHERSGHLFQGPYKAVHIKDNRQLLYLSSYVHKNPKEINEWKNKEHLYPWSSYQDFVKENRWGKLLQQNIILDQFSNKKEYGYFVKSSPAKELKNNLNDKLLIDF